MGALVPFTFEAHEVRVLDRTGAPWFVLADVCKALEIANPRDAGSRLDDDEKDTVGIADGIQKGPGNPNLTVINESGLWSLVLRSQKPEAKRFKKWITAEVIPTIRRTGSYGTPGAPIPVEISDLIRSELAGAVLEIKGDVARTLTGALETVLPAMVRSAVDSSSFVLTRDYVTVGQILDEQQVPSKGRRGLVTLVAKSLRTWCIARAVTPKERDIGTRRPTYLYPVAEARAWLAAEGADMIRRWAADQASKQLSLALPKPKARGRRP